MITTERIVEVLKNHQKDGIAEINVTPEGFVCADLENGIDANRPYTLIVHPDVEQQILSISISLHVTLRQDSNIPRALARHNNSLTYGYLAIGCENQERFTTNHVCRCDDDNDPPPELFDRLLDGMIADLQYVEMATLFGAMLDAGIPRNRADTIMEILFPDEQVDEPAEEN